VRGVSSAWPQQQVGGDALTKTCWADGACWQIMGSIADAPLGC